MQHSVTRNMALRAIEPLDAKDWEALTKDIDAEPTPEQIVEHKVVLERALQANKDIPTVIF